VEESLLHLSVSTIGEIETGIAKLRSPKRAARLQRWIEEELAARFEGRLLPSSAGAASRWARICGEAERQGKKPPAIDSLIGATAIVHGLTVATRNVADISRTGAAVVNPWESSTTGTAAILRMAHCDASPDARSLPGQA